MPSAVVQHDSHWSIQCSCSNEKNSSAPSTEGWVQRSSGRLPATTCSLCAVHRPHHCTHGPANTPIMSLSHKHAGLPHPPLTSQIRRQTLCRDRYHWKGGTGPGQPNTFSPSSQPVGNLVRKGEKQQRKGWLFL